MGAVCVLWSVAGISEKKQAMKVRDFAALEERPGIIEALPCAYRTFYGQRGVTDRIEFLWLRNIILFMGKTC